MVNLSGLIHSGALSRPIAALFIVSALLTGCQQADTDLNIPASQLVVPSDFPPLPIPANNPITPAKVELGQRLFYDVRLSRNDSLSCSSCHQLSASFSDFGRAISPGFRGGRGTRNSPALVNVAYNTAFFWDGRATSLEEQAAGPILNSLELASDTATVVSKIAADGMYKDFFTKAFGDNIVTFGRITQAIATFERTLITGSSPYDAFNRGDSSALSPAAKRGLILFNDSEINCVGCHSGFNFTDNDYHSTGLDFQYADVGRENVTGRKSDNGKFLTPSLRNIALSPPYMHDGRFTTLLQVMAHYNEGGKHNPSQDTLIRRLNLTDQQMNDIIAFMNSLTDKSYTSRKDFTNPFKQ